MEEENESFYYAKLQLTFNAEPVMRLTAKAEGSQKTPRLQLDALFHANPFLFSIAGKIHSRFFLLPNLRLQSPNEVLVMVNFFFVSLRVKMHPDLRFNYTLRNWRIFPFLTRKNPVCA